MINKKYLYEKIYFDFIDKIENGFYREGDKIPTEQELTEDYGVSRMTVKSAIKMLVDEGYIERQSGVGSFVKSSNVNKDETSLNINVKDKNNRSIGLVLGRLWSSYGIEIFDGIYDRAREYGYNLIFKKSYGEIKKEGEALVSLIKMGVEGIIIVPVHGEYYSQELLKLFVDGFPLVFIDRYLDGINIPVISTDNFKASKDAVNYFIKKGNKDIGLITTRDGYASSLNDRKKGYLQALTDNNIEIKNEYIFDQDINYFTEGNIEFQYENYIKSICDYFKKNKKITAVFTTEYHTANIIKIALNRLEKKIGEDIEIICFDQPKIELGEYEFTFIEQNQSEMGKIAVDTILKIIKGEKISRKIFIESKFIEGKSTR